MLKDFRIKVFVDTGAFLRVFQTYTINAKSKDEACNILESEYYMPPNHILKVLRKNQK